MRRVLDLMAKWTVVEQNRRVRLSESDANNRLRWRIEDSTIYSNMM